MRRERLAELALPAGSCTLRRNPVKLFGGGKPDHPMADAEGGQAPPRRAAGAGPESRRSRSWRTGTSRWRWPRASGPSSASSCCCCSTTPRSRACASSRATTCRRRAAFALPGEPAVDARCTATGARPASLSRAASTSSCKARKGAEAAKALLPQLLVRTLRASRSRSSGCTCATARSTSRCGACSTASTRTPSRASWRRRSAPCTRAAGANRRRSSSSCKGVDVQRERARRPAARGDRAGRAPDRRARAALRDWPARPRAELPFWTDLAQADGAARARARAAARAGPALLRRRRALGEVQALAERMVGGTAAVPAGLNLGAATSAAGRARGARAPGAVLVAAAARAQGTSATA